MVEGSTRLEHNFYSKLNPIKDYRQICDLSMYKDVPHDWMMVLCDIRGSTKAIENGKYKEVNFLGAACITALLNKFQGIQLPYVFGGDGATLLIPEEFKEEASVALGAVKNLARSQYDMELRMAVIPLKDLLKDGFKFKIAKHALSDELSIALFSGDGFFEAEKRVKESGAYLIDEKYSEVLSGADTEGLECRWEALPAKRGEIISVLVKATSKDVEVAAEIYQKVIAEISSIFGDRESVSPATEDKLKLNLNPAKFTLETKLKVRGFLSVIAYSFFIAIQTVIGQLLMTFGVKTLGVDWGLYKRKVAKHSDYWKFDDTLRFVFDVSSEQKSVLIWCLEKYKKQGDIYYGTHSSSSALMTCLVFNRGGNHVHFIDGADGGYALAASELKRSMKKN